MMVHIRSMPLNRRMVSALLACALAASARPPALAAPTVQEIPAHRMEPPALRLDIAASAGGISSDDPEFSLESEMRIAAGGAVVRLWARQALETAPPAAPRAGLAFVMPYLRFGATKPVGLAAFVYAPAASGTLLLGQSGSPLAVDDPADPACLGISLGEDYGAFIGAPSGPEEPADLGRTAWGGWFSPRGGSCSVLALVSGSSAEAGGPGWYDVPSPAARRVFAALSGSAAGAGWAVATAAAGGAGFPGQDAAACRAEARVSAGGFRLDAVGSAACAAWAGPDGRSAPFGRLAADVRYAGRGYSASLGFRYVRSDAPGTEAVSDGADVAWSGALEARGWFGQARAAASMQTGTGTAGTATGWSGAPETGTASAVEVDARWRPDFVPWLALASAWRASGGGSERFDISARASLGMTTRIVIDSGLRFVPEGRLVRGALSLARTLGAVWVSCSVRTSGWIETSAAWPESLEFSFNATANLE